MTDAERDREREEYRSEVVYRVWKSGGNPDAVSYDRVENAYWGHRSEGSAVADELRRQRPPEPEPPEDELEPPLDEPNHGDCREAI